MATYLITYKKRGGKTHLVEMPTMQKLLAWIEKNATKCDTIFIQKEDA